MCPLWPLHYLLMYLFVLIPLWIISFHVVETAAAATESLKGSVTELVFQPYIVPKLMMGHNETVSVRSRRAGNEPGVYFYGGTSPMEFDVMVDDPNIAEVYPGIVYLSSSTEYVDHNNNNLTGSLEALTLPVNPDQVRAEFNQFNVTGKFLGRTRICLKKRGNNGHDSEDMTIENTCMDVTVIRSPRSIDSIFTTSVAGLVGIMYVNMGACLNLPTVRQTLRKPIGPLIGFVSQFVIMPLLSFGLAKLLIPLPPLQLGLFMTGCSPGGGASNIWTAILRGNLDLSITMTSISSLAAFVMMPIWILTLGATICEDAKVSIPFSKIATFAAALLLPLIIGVLIQRFNPVVTKCFVKILKPFAACLIIFIVVFAIYTNIYLFQLLTWEIILAGMLLPWIGYLFGGGLALIFRQDWKDVLAIAIETGVQNTGLSIFALRFSMPQPEADLTTVMPVAVAIMTPVIPALVFIGQKISNRGHKKCSSSFENSPDTLAVSTPI